MQEKEVHGEFAKMSRETSFIFIIFTFHLHKKKKKTSHHFQNNFKYI